MEDDVWEETKKYNLEAKKSPLIGFRFDNSSVLNESSQIVAILDEYGVVHRGYQDPDEYLGEMIERISNAGEDKLYAEVQKQIDEFIKNKK